MVEPGQPDLVSAFALPPACKNYRRAYPVTALLGPGLPEPPPDVRIPFPIPEGYGVVYAANPRIVPARARPVFSFPEGDYAWFLPEGLSEDGRVGKWFCLALEDGRGASARLARSWGCSGQRAVFLRVFGENLEVPRKSCSA